MIIFSERCNRSLHFLGEHIGSPLHFIFSFLFPSIRLKGRARDGLIIFFWNDAIVPYHFPSPLGRGARGEGFYLEIRSHDYLNFPPFFSTFTIISLINWAFTSSLIVSVIDWMYTLKLKLLAWGNLSSSS